MRPPRLLGLLPSAIILSVCLWFSWLQVANAACSVVQFECRISGKCLPKRDMCDDHLDCCTGSVEECDDVSDEEPSICPGTGTCTGSQFACSDGQCIPQGWACDGEADCNDGGDENSTLCANVKCEDSKYPCPKQAGYCIPMHWLCDGQDDCNDGSDEDPSQCRKNCTSSHFTCTSGQCIEQRWMCDGDKDCDDGSDEKNCPDPTCSSKEFTCDNGACISKKWYCDGGIDCADGSDERDCPIGVNSTGPVNPCEDHEFMCDNRRCIFQDWKCDGDDDCSDGSDEKADVCPNNVCRKDQFTCKKFHQCIPGHLECNGMPECKDKSDEDPNNCPTTMSPCDPKTEFDCGAMMCIGLHLVCNGENDCGNWEDEPRDKCNKNECKVDNGGCQQTCTDTPDSFYCDCEDGYQLVDKTKCVDINECKIPGSCSQHCENTEGGFKCSCLSGYERDPRNHTRCKAADGHASLLFTHEKDIRKISLNQHEMTAIVNNTRASVALDYVFRTGMIFWGDRIQEKIYKAPIDEGSDSTVVISAKITSDGLAVDWIYNHLYWTDDKRDTIEVSTYDGKMRKVLIEDHMQNPRALALNPLEGWMYWTDWGINAKIERAGMDGSHRQTIVEHDVMWPNGLTLDLLQKRMYWIDGKLKILVSSDFDGKNRRTILSSDSILQQPFSITTFEDYLYWTDWDHRAIFKANKFNARDAHPITPYQKLVIPMVIHVYHPYRQPEGPNYCSPLNGHCSHLCLPAPRISEHSAKISCACPDGLVMGPDDFNCVAPTEENYGNTIGYNTTDLQESQEDHAGSTAPATMKEAEPTEVHNNGTVAVIIIGIGVAMAVIIAVVLFVVYRHCIRSSGRPISFHNQVYKKTTADSSQLHPPSSRPMHREDTGLEPLTSPGTNEYV